MKLHELLEGVALTRNSAERVEEIRRLCIDSRLIERGDVFFALPGAKSDGHDYIEAALAGGASLVVAERDENLSGPHVLVPDAHKALAEMAANFYGHPSRAMRMIGVTGTNGKTTVTHILKGILEQARGAKVGLIGTNANRIGDREIHADRTTPDALGLQALLCDMVEAGCTYCVMEVSSHALAQSRVWGIQYNQAIFTNLTQDHLDYHRDMEDYFGQKERLFAHADVGIINLDDAYGRRLMERPELNTVTYSAQRDMADVVAKNIRYKSSRVEFEAVTTSEIARIEWSTPGAFSVYNALAAVTAALVEGLSLREISDAVRRIPPVKGRMEVVRGPGDVPVIIDYAHTPDALKNLIAAIRSYHDGHLITLFGCGGDRDKTKRPQMAAAAAEQSDLLIVTSDNPRTEPPMAIIEDILRGLPEHAPPVIVEQDRSQAIGRALREAHPGDVVALCGKGHEDYQEIDGQKYPFDERDIVAQWLEKIGEQ